MILLLALTLAAAPPPAAQPPKAGESEAEALIATCNAHKFETMVDVSVNDQPHKSKVKLCGKPGQTDADWLLTLKDALAKVEANPTMTASVKGQIVTAFKAEIARTEAGLAAPAVAPLAVAQPPARPPEYSTLPPFPPPPVAGTSVLGPVTMGPAGTVAAASDYVAPPPPPLLARPRFTLRCLNPGDIAGEGPCLTLDRDTLLTVQADENMPAGTSLRFVRKGDVRGELELARLRKGQSLRARLPQPLCSGVSGSRVEIQVVRSAGASTQIVGREGPYELRC